MLIIDSFGKNIFIGDNLVGYLAENVMIINGHRFAEITDDGKIFFPPKQIGYVEEDGSIIINGKEVGYIDEGNNFVFYNSVKFGK